MATSWALIVVALMAVRVAMDEMVSVDGRIRFEWIVGEAVVGEVVDSVVGLDVVLQSFDVVVVVGIGSNFSVAAVEIGFVVVWKEQIAVGQNLEQSSFGCDVECEGHCCLGERRFENYFGFAVGLNRMEVRPVAENVVG